MKWYLKCEIKTASRWQRVTVNKWVIAIEPNHLNGWFIQERNTIMLLRDAKQWLCLEWFLFLEIERKKWICCLKRKTLDINFLFIELLYKINVTFAIMQTSGEKRHSSCDSNYIKWYINYIDLKLIDLK